MVDSDIRRRAELIVRTLAARGQMMVTVESCTGGLIGGALTEVPGSSGAVHGGFITYANAAKQNMVGVPAALLQTYGAVSEPVARAMAEGARAATGVAIAVSVTGIAGPDGGTPDKPVGLVHFACATSEGTAVAVERFGDIGRRQVRRASVARALDLVLAHIGSRPDTAP